MFAGRAVRIMIHAYRLCLVATGYTVICVHTSLYVHKSGLKPDSFHFFHLANVNKFVV